MGVLLTGGSIIAAFFAGAIALFSPCCIVFLFPAYLASAVKNRRHILPLTLVFAVGLGIVLLPITLGVGLLSNTIAKYHTQLYYVGGVLLLALAVLSLLGKSWSMPSFVRSPSMEHVDTGGMFALGVFSGVASSCCAPVLVGVMALSALSNSLVGSVSLGLAYVFGMVFPLFVLAVLWDRLRMGERRLFTARVIRFRVAGKAFATNTMNLLVAVAFALMGGMVLFLAINGNTTAAPGFQLAIGRWLTDVFSSVTEVLDPVPEPVLALGLLGLALLFVIAAVRGASRSAGEADAGSPGGRSCHDHQDPSEPGLGEGEEERERVGEPAR